MLGDDARLRRDGRAGCAEDLEHPRQQLGLRVGGIDEDDIELDLGIRLAEPADDVPADDGGIRAGQVCRPQVGIDDGGRALILVHEGRAGRAARQGFDPARAAAGKQDEAEDIPLAAQLEVLLRKLEAVAGLDDRLEPCLRRLVDAVGDEDAEALPVPRPTRPRSWWSWASPNRSAPSITIIVASATST